LIDDSVGTTKTGQGSLENNLTTAMANDLDESSGSGAARLGGRPRVISSRDIMGDDRLVVIRHEDEFYRLQRTAAGKLILTK
jgi:hemin uptake protein HemP